MSLQVRKIGQVNIAASSLALFTVGLLRRNIPLLRFSGIIFSQQYTLYKFLRASLDRHATIIRRPCMNENSTRTRAAQLPRNIDVSFF